MQRSLRTRLTVILLSISIIPLLLAAILGIQQNISVQIEQAVAQQNEVASRVSIQTEEYINRAVDNLRLLIEAYDINTLTKPEQGTLLRNTLNISTVLKSIAITDATGKEVIKISRSAVFNQDDLRNIANEPAFQQAAQTQEIYYGDLTFDSKTSLPYMTLSIPIIDRRSGKTAGVLVADLRFQAIWTLMTESAQNFRVVYMTDLDGRIVAHANPSFAYQGLSQGLSFAYPEQGMLMKGLEEKLAVIGRSDVYLENQATFIVITELPWTNALSTSIRFVQIAIFLILATIGAIYFLSIRLTRSFTSPIEALAITAKEIQHGDLTARVDIQSGDEVGLLGEAFNRMASQLQDVLAGLETRVSERTEELESSLSQNSQRAQQLEAIAVAARAIATLENIDELLPNITELVSERFDFYHVGIFLLDAEGKFAVLRAANSEGGKAMMARDHKLRIGKEGVVGYAVAHKQARIALDVGDDAVFFDNPELPNTHSEMALPLTMGNKVIGVLDIQSEEIGAFTEDDIEVLSTLADQIAVAIQNARLFAQSQETLAELERTFQQYVRSEWKRFIEVSNIKGYVAQQTGIQPISTKTSLQKDDKAEKSDTAYKVPVKLRDVVIGHINVDLDKPVSEYTVDELDLIHAAVERFTLALENARLLETTTRRARRESLVSEVTTKIRSTNDPDEMVKTAMEELKKILGASKVDLQAYQPKGTITESSEDE